MAAISSVGTGVTANWSSSSTWTGGVVPCINAAVTNVVIVSTVATITLGSSVSWSNGDTVNLYGIGGITGINGAFTITVSTGTIFTITGTFSGTYTSGGVAYHGDTVTISAKDAVTLDSPACDANGQLIVGTDPGTGGTAAITIGSSAQSAATSLTVATGLTLRLRGDLTIIGQNSNGGHFSTLTMSSGSSLIHDPSSGNTYVRKFSYVASIVCNGTTNSGNWPDSTGGNHVIVKTDTTRGGGNVYDVPLGGYPNTATVWGGFTSCAFTEFSNQGTTSASQYGILIYLDTHQYGYATMQISMTNCTFNNSCYCILAEDSTTAWTGNYIWNNNLASSSILNTSFSASPGVSFWFTVITAPTAETKEILNSGFDALVTFDHPTNHTVTGNVFANGIRKSNPFTWANATQFNNNVISLSAVMAIQGGPIKNCYFLIQGSSGISVFESGNNGSAGSVTGCIFEQMSGNGILSCIMINMQGNTLVAKLNMILPAPGDGASPGVLIFTNSFTGVTCEHNLQCGTAHYGMVQITGSVQTGYITSFQANISYATASTSNYAIANYPSNTFTTDAVTLAGHNAFFNPTTGTCEWGPIPTSQSGVNGYIDVRVSTNGSIPNAQLGSGDFVANPNFVDSARNSAKWNNVVNGGTATAAAALAALLANPSLIPSLFSYVRAGFVPTNVIYVNTTYNGDPQTTDAAGNPTNGAVGPMGIVVNYMPWIYGDQIQEIYG